MCSVATHLAAPFSPGPLLHHIPSLCWSAPSAWRKLFGPGVGLGQTFLGASALGHCSAERGDRNHRSDKRLWGALREGDSFQLKWPGVLRGGQKSCVTAQRQRDLHSDVTWRRKRALLGWQEQAVDTEHKSFRTILNKWGCESRNPTCLGWSGLITN